MEQSQLNNGILRRLASEDFDALSPYLRRIEFAYEEELITPNVPIPTVYFIESGMLSMVISSHGSEPIEVGLIGREGMTDHVVELGDRSVLRCFAHVAGSALAVDAAEFAKWLRTRPAAFLLLHRYQQVSIIQLSFTALAHGSFSIVERLARWLLMCFDRTDEVDLTIVHDKLAELFAVRRSSITTALHVLKGYRALRCTRGKIHLSDRGKLEKLTAGSYGVAESEYKRILGPIRS